MDHPQMSNHSGLMIATTSHQPVLVLGANGKTGRRIVERLRARDVPVRQGSRMATPSFDWQSQRTWDAVVDGVRAAYISFQPDLAVPGAPETVGAFAHLAVQAGVQRLVLLSGRGEQEALRAEEIVQACGAEVTVLRCSWFTQNFTEGTFVPDVLSGEVMLPVGSVREPFLDADDIADAAVAALLDNGHAGRLYELTGPRLMSFEDAVAEIASVTGRPITFHPVPLEEYAAILNSVGVSADEVALVTYLFSKVLDGRNESVTDGVRQVLGRSPRDLRDSVRTALAAGALAA
jgi:uncharacterized protein YbjT (DUF2867 family)